jgi:uncharacterized protein YkwD
MNRNTNVHAAQKVFSVLLAVIFTLYPTPVFANDPIPQIGEPVSLENSEMPENSLAFNGCYRVEVGALNASYEQRMVELVNQRRAENGLPPLKRSLDLDYSARYHAKDMMDDNYFNHDSKDRVNNELVNACTWSERIQNFYNRNYLGENLAAGYSTPDSALSALMNSDGHRANILNPNYYEIGIGYMEMGGSYGRYWVQDFGQRSNVYPIVINQEAASAYRRQVSLFIYGQDVWNEMRLRNDNGTWSAWQPFQKSLSWVLPVSSGMHTVWVEMRRTDGTTAAASDTINLMYLPHAVFIPTVRR